LRKALSAKENEEDEGEDEGLKTKKTWSKAKRLDVAN